MPKNVRRRTSNSGRKRRKGVQQGSIRMTNALALTAIVVVMLVPIFMLLLAMIPKKEK